MLRHGNAKGDTGMTICEICIEASKATGCGIEFDSMRGEYYILIDDPASDDIYLGVGEGATLAGVIAACDF